MSRPLQKLRRFFRELKRRNVYQVAGTYAVVGFVLIQLADLTFVRLGLPTWTVTLVIVLVAMGFPLTIVLAWAFEMSPEGVRRTPSDAEAADEGTSGAGEGLSTGYKLLVGLGLTAAALAGGWYLTGGGGERPEVAEGTVAVLPFQVSGPEAETWREGMVTVLSTGLDGAASLRAIPDQTVLAAWERTASEASAGSEDPSLATARSVGAEFAVIGQAAELGKELVLSADVYRTGGGERLGQAEARGVPDSVSALADSLARGVLGILLERGGGELPAVDLGRVTTRSRAALRAYLEGERHFRDGDFVEAAESYQAAIREDSTFALAYTRLTHAAGWGGVLDVHDPLLRLRGLSDRLPTRDRRLVQALYDWVHSGDRLAAADTLRGLTRTYPDDPAVWYNLGEVLWHGGVPGGWPEAEEAFQRAVELDPGVAGYHHHLVDLAFVLHHDSALAASRIAALPGRADRERLLRLSLDLVFGTEEARSEALGRVETVPVPNDWALWFMLRHPEDGGLEDRVLRILLDREGLRKGAGSGVLRHTRSGLVLNGLEHGHLRRAVSDAERLDLHPARIACYLAGLISLDIPVADSIAAPYLDPSRLRPNAPRRHLKCVGTYLVDSGRGEELDTVLARLDDAPVDEGPWASVGLARTAGSASRLLRGYRAWRSGELDLAARLLSDSSPWDWWAGTGAIWRGDFYRDLGQLETAEGWYMAAWWHPVTHERLGRLYEEMGEPEKAADAYRRFIAGWEDADPELQPRVEEARERLNALTGSEAEPED